MIGTFYPPDSILICPEFFKTLEKRDLYSGLGEVVKFNIIAGEEKLIDLEQKISLLLDNDRDTVVRFVLQSLVFKKTFIEADEFDCGERIKLNFAHTFGHAIEVASKYSISHGTAVAMGLVTADYISVKRNMMSVSLANRVESLIKKIVTMDLSVTAFDIDVIIEAIHKDKKQTSSHITAILLDESYELHITDDISIAEVKKAFDYLIEFIKR
jgi:3-dehydroquinate synthase